MHELEANFGNWVIRYRWLIIVASLLIVVLAGSGGKHLSFTTNYRVFFSEDNPQLLAFDALENTYTKNDNMMFVISPKDGKVFSNQALEVVERLTDMAWQLPYSIRVDSISNFQHTEAEEDDLIVRDLVEGAEGLSASEIEKIKTIALNEPLLVQRLISRDGRVTAVNATIQLPGKDETREVPQVVKAARDMAAQISKAYPAVEIRLTGMVMMNNAFSEASKGDMQTLVPISFGLMLLILILLLRALSGAFATLLVILFSIVVAMGTGGYIGFPLTPPSAASPTIILTVAIANSVHVLVTFLHEMRHGVEKNAAVIESLRVNLQPVFLASATTAIGFLSMNFSEVPPFQHLGNFVAIGVLASFVFSVTLLPALMTLLPVRIRHYEQGADTAMMKLGNFVVDKRRPLFWGMGLIIVVLIAFIPRNELNDIFVQYFDKTVTFRQHADYTTENLTGLYVADYSLPAGESSGISEPEFLQEVAGFAEWYRQQPETLHVNVFTDIMKRLNKNMHADDESWYRLPDERDLAAQFLLLYEMSLPYGLDLNNQINIDKSSTRMTASLKTMSTNELLALEQRAGNWLAENTRLIATADASGPSMMFAHIGKRNIISMLGGTTLALIVISLLLIVALRSVKIGLVSMMPNLVPAAMGFGLWGMLVGEVGLALSVVTTMTLGIVVDDTVHFLSKYLRARRERGYSSPDAVRYAFNTVGRALLTTSIVLVAGFLVLSQSTFELNSGMGLLTAIVITFALVADFLLLPPLLMKLEGTKDEETSTAAVVHNTAS